MSDSASNTLVIPPGSHPATARLADAPSSHPADPPAQPAGGPAAPQGPAPAPRRVRSRWRRWRTPLIVTAVLALVAGGWRLTHPPKPPAAPPVGEVKLADITQLVQASGILQARTKVDVGAQVSGQVQTLHVELGQNVKKGDLLVSLDPEIARSDLAQAEAAVAQQKAQLERMKVDIELTQREVQRQQRLLAGSATAGQEAENAQGQLDKLQADFRGQQASMQRLQADLAKRQLNLGYTRITAPMDGTVVNIPVQAGQTVIAVQITPVMVTLAQLDTITVRARVPEADVSSVKVGQVARFSTLSGEGRQYEGRVRVIQPVPEHMGNAVYYNVLFEVDNKDRSLLSDMTVQVNIETGSAKQVPTLPMVALGERDAQGRYEVQLYKPGSEQDAAHKPELRKVRIGLQDGGKAQVLEGVKPGEKLLLAPVAKKAGDGDAGVIVD